MEQYISRIINNYWMRLSGISRIIEAEVGVTCRDNVNRGPHSSRYPAKTEFNNYFIIHIIFIYLLFFVRNIFRNYSLLFFVRKQKTGFACFTNYYSQARRHNYRIPGIICRCDVIITNTKNFL